MKRQVRALVIGGGVVGCSVLYHLTKLGWAGRSAVERKELTAGSSWHAAGAFHALNSDPAMSRLQAYTVGALPELEKISGQDIGLHYPGGLNVAATQERWDLLRADARATRRWASTRGSVGPAEIRELVPSWTSAACSARSMIRWRDISILPAPPTRSRGRRACRARDLSPHARHSRSRLPAAAPGRLSPIRADRGRARRERRGPLGA